MEKSVTDPEVRDVLIIGARGYPAYHHVEHIKIEGQWILKEILRQNGGKENKAL